VATYNDLDAGERVRIFDRTGEASAAAGSGGGGGPLAYGYGDSMAPCIDFKEPLVVEDQHFIDCIIARAPPTADGVSGLVVVATLEAVERSLSSGKTVELDLPEHSGADAVRMPRVPEIAEVR
jgi:predicted dehydrogenase